MEGTLLTDANKTVKLAVKDGKAVCPRCGRATGQLILPGTRLLNFALYCKLCKQTTVVSYRAPEPEPEPMRQSQSQSQ